jgi:hypothetical protein
MHGHIRKHAHGRLFNCGNKKNYSMFHFKGDTIVALWLLIQMNCKEINGCVRIDDCHLLFSVWHQHHQRPFPCSSMILTERICFCEVYDCEKLVWETERCPALYDCLLKECGDEGLIDWGRSEWGCHFWVEMVVWSRETWKR